MRKETYPRLLTITSLVLLIVVSRFIPHPPNFAPVMSMALFGGAAFADKRLAFLIPLVAMFVSDIFLGFYALLPVVYLCYVVVVFLGFSMRNKITIGKIVSNSIMSSLLFFFVTNFAYWLFSGAYPMNLNGLTMCFTAAIAFYKYPALGIETSFLLNTLFGTLLYSGALFGGLHIAEKFIPQVKLSPIEVTK